MSVLRVLRQVLFSFAILGLVVPLLFSQWIRGNSDRYLWIINQGFPCSTMGSGPFQLFVLGIFPWAAALVVGVIAWLLPPRDAIRDDMRRGLVIGVAFAALTAAGMFLLPGWFASLLGC